MPDRTQTLSVKLERIDLEQAEAGLEEARRIADNWRHVNEDAAGVIRELEPALELLRAVLSQPEHQGDESRIAKLQALEPGWDSYDGEVPTEKALERLRGFDRALAYVPLPDGGVQVEFHALGLDFEAVIDPAGQVAEFDLQPPAPVLSDEERERLGLLLELIEDPTGEDGELDQVRATKALEREVESTEHAEPIAVETLGLLYSFFER